jgi:hypothetical protein
LGGGPFQLIVQAISAICLTIWACIATLVILWFVNATCKIRLSPEDEIKGCDSVEHLVNDIEEPKNFDKIIVNRKFSGLTENEIIPRQFENFGRRKTFHVNHGYMKE